jgi:hypothetical protein
MRTLQLGCKLTRGHWPILLQLEIGRTKFRSSGKSKQENTVMANLKMQFTQARRVSTPQVCVRTPDSTQTTKNILSTLNGEIDTAPLFRWDAVRGLMGLNKIGKETVSKLLGAQPQAITRQLAVTLALSENLPDDSILFVLNSQRFWNDPVVMQGICNLRDALKPLGAMIVLLASLDASLPSELSQDVLLIDESLPSASELEPIVKRTYSEAGRPEPDENEVSKAIDAVIGLAAFPAEQSLAMSVRKADGMHLEELWEHKRVTVSQTPGLSVWKGTETFESLRGLASLKSFCKAVLNGKSKVRVIVFIDEIEKHFAGTGTETGQVKTEMTGTFLTWMQDKHARGAILIGHAGTGKSAIAKAMGNTAGIPTIVMDFSGMQGSLVGQSGATLRKALAVIDAVSEGSAFLVATCNKLDSLPPELRRRFKRGTFFVDLPTAEERSAIWDLYRTKYSIPASEQEPDSTDWTGAEIETCCETADDLKLSLKQAANYIVPISRSAPEAIRSLRTFADNRFLSASETGVYHFEETASEPKQTRKVRN